MSRLRFPNALPGIEGRWVVPVKAVWFALLALALLGTTFGTWAMGTAMRDSNRVWAELGLRSTPGEGQSLMVHPFGSAGRQAGIAPNSLLLAINGTPIIQGNEKAVLDRAGPSPMLRLASPGEAPRELRLVRDPRNALAGDPGLPFSYATLQNIILGSAFAINIAFLSVAILLFRRRPRDPVAMLLSAGMLLIVGSDIGALPFAFLETFQGHAVGLGWTMIVIALFAFPNGRFYPRWTLIGVPLALLYLADRYFQVAIGYPLYLILMGLAVAAIAHRYVVLPPGPARQQVKWSLLGFAAGLACSVALSASASIAARFVDDAAASMWLQLANVFFYTGAFVTFALGLLVSLLRYRLYDADAAISRSAGYAVLTLLLAGTFGASAKLIEWFFETSFGADAGALPGAIGAGLAVVLITPMHNRIHGWTERRFQKALLRLRRDLPDCVGDLRETAGMAELLDEILTRILAGTRAVRAAVVIEGETVAARGEGGADFPVSVPLRVEYQRMDIGALRVGPRPDGSAPGKDERDALAEIADPIARAVRIVRLREAKQHRQESEMAELRASLERLTRSDAGGSGNLPT
ncbi:MAG TPA: hypothetical protein VMG08_11495 [Allosphingosinicella sp.]|nr:hypothetical protein [Allosphingosinicella sp.]